jgi:glycosyltransferase involved in cell wall biosynthesis
MSEPLVTVGICFFNCERSLLAAVKSVFSQTFQGWELILLDGGSTDKSLEIAKSIKDPRVRVVGDGHYCTHPAALNQLTDLARGKYIANMDGDDLCSPMRLQKQLDLFIKDPSLDVIGTGIIYLDGNDLPLGQAIFPPSHEEICRTPYRTVRLCHGSIMGRRVWHLQNRYNESAVRMEDFDLWLRSYQHSNFSNVCEALYYYRCETSFSQKKLLIARINCIKLIWRHYVKSNMLKAFSYSLLQITKMVGGPIICLLISQRELIQKRYAPLDEIEKGRNVETIEFIKNTNVPVEDL